MPGFDPGIHETCNTTTPYRWIAGSSPAMTAWLVFRLAPRTANAGGQCRHQLGHGFDRARRGLALFVEAVFYRADQRRADHHALGAGGKRARLLRGAHPEADRDRQFG